MSISIKRHELREYQATELKPRLREEWRDLGDLGLLRQSGFVLQGLSLFRFAHWKGFRIYFGLQLTIVPDEHLHALLGGTLRHETPRWPRFPWLGRVSRELWVDWEARFEWSEGIIALAREQIEPSIMEPLTVDRAAPFIARQAEASQHEVVAWSAAMIKALQGGREEALADLQRLRVHMVEQIEAGRHGQRRPVAPHYLQTAERLAVAIDALGSEEQFAHYCEETSRTTELAIGLRRPTG